MEFYNPGRLPENITVENLLTNNYKSTPRNRLTADFCKSMGLIEKYGSGIKRIVAYFKEARLTTPEFRNISDGFMVIVFSDSSDKVTDKVTENQQRIISLILEKSTITSMELSEIIGISDRKTKDNIKKLKSMGIIRRIGSDKGGHWQIIKD
ncbi:MAG: ATP-binding protein [Bacteroidales bacterium]|nr:ATP-binding protein [Bacteroidales bacterium]